MPSRIASQRLKQMELRKKVRGNADVGYRRFSPGEHVFTQNFRCDLDRRTESARTHPIQHQDGTLGSGFTQLRRECWVRTLPTAPRSYDRDESTTADHCE